MTESDRGEGHSAAYFGASRDYWYNADFVTLMAARWRLGEVHSALDVGCGVGHWGRLLAPHLHPEARVRGVDPESKWVAEASRRAAANGLGGRFSYRLGAVEKLPFHDASFDLVTCQTVLIHVADVRAALAEMIRVTKPGGLVAVAEPNNVAATLALGSETFDDDVDELLDVTRLHVICQRGKAALGQGHNSIGDLVPGLFAEAGLADVSVHLSDKAYAHVPPYASDDERARMAEAIAWARDGMWLWSRDDTSRYFAAGGGIAGDFERLWALAGRRANRIADALAARRHHEAGGAMTYLISGRRPA